MSLLVHRQFLQLMEFLDSSSTQQFVNPFSCSAVYALRALSLQTHRALSELSEAHLSASFFYLRAYFTSPLPVLVPKQQPLLVYLCVFAL